MLIQYEHLIKKPKLAVEELAAFIDRPVTIEALRFIEPKLRHF
jgi:hypothetical protein